MNTFEFTDNEFSINVLIAENSDGNLVASTEFDFIKYESDPVKFSFNKMAKIHENINYSLTIEKSLLRLEYSNELLDFSLLFIMKKEKMSPEKETLVKIKKAADQINKLNAAMADLQSKVYFGLEIVNKTISFRYSKENGLYMVTPNSRFEELLKLMNCQIYPTHTHVMYQNWTEIYPSISELMQNIDNLYYVNNGNHKTPVLQSIDNFISNNCQNLMTFHPSTNHDYPKELKNSGKKSIIVAEVRILAFPPYSVFPYETTEEQKEYKNYKIANRIYLGDLWKGYCSEVCVGKKMLLWNHKKIEIDLPEYSDDE